MALCSIHSVGIYMMACSIPLNNNLLTGIGGAMALVSILWEVTTLLRNYLRQNP